MGYCRPVDGNERVNSRGRLLPFEDECSDACSLLEACVGYAYAFSTGICWLYGAGLDEGLTVFNKKYLSTTEWEGSSQPNIEIRGA